MLCRPFPRAPPWAGELEPFRLKRSLFQLPLFRRCRERLSGATFAIQTSSCCSAPRGRHAIAWGNAPGTRSSNGPALKGRDRRALCRPFRAPASHARTPGALPQAIELGPFRADDDSPLALTPSCARKATPNTYLSEAHPPPRNRPGVESNTSRPASACSFVKHSQLANNIASYGNLRANGERNQRTFRGGGKSLYKQGLRQTNLQLAGCKNANPCRSTLRKCDAGWTGFAQKPG